MFLKEFRHAETCNWLQYQSHYLILSPCLLLAARPPSGGSCSLPPLELIYPFYRIGKKKIHSSSSSSRKIQSFRQRLYGCLISLLISWFCAINNYDLNSGSHTLQKSSCENTLTGKCFVEWCHTLIVFQSPAFA